MADNVIISKCESIERCIRRIREDYAGFESEFHTNYTRQDAILLNLQRACEQTIDLANYLVRQKRLGPPRTSRDALDLLEKAEVIDLALGDALRGMVGFRNIAVHNYQKINLTIVESIINHHLGDFEKFVQVALSQ